MKKPKVTIIIPVYNVEEYLSACLDSIINQTFKDIEIICINDGSTDNSRKILRKYKRLDSRIKVVNQENQGLSCARNTGIMNATGKYLQFVDSDDELELETIEALYQEITSNDLDLILFDIKPHLYDTKYEDNYRIYLEYYKRSKEYSNITTGEKMFCKMYNNGDYLPSAVPYLVKTNLIKRKELSFYSGIIHEDNLFTLQLLFNAERVKHIRKEFYIRNVRDGSIMTKKVTSKNVHGYFVTIRELISFFEDKTLDKNSANVLSKYLINSLLQNLFQNIRKLPAKELDNYRMSLGTGDLILFDLLYKKQFETVNKVYLLEQNVLRLNRIKKSYSYRLGKVLLFLPKKIYKIHYIKKLSKSFIKISRKIINKIKSLFLFFYKISRRDYFLFKKFLEDIQQVETSPKRLPHENFTFPIISFNWANKELLRKSIVGQRDLEEHIQLNKNKRYKPKISIIMPIYNSSEYLNDAINDIKNQTFKEFELICIDDKSKDDSLGQVIEIAKTDNRIRLFQQKKQNAGIARNLGIYLARGDFLIFLDSDDRFEKNLLEEMYKKITNTSSDICICNANKLYSPTNKILPADFFIKTEQIPNIDIFNIKDLKENIFFFVKPAPWNKIFRKSFIKENHIWFQEIERCNDLFFVFFALAKAKKISIVNKNLVHYRVGLQSNLQSGNDQTPFNFLKALLLLKSSLEKEGLLEGSLKRSYISMAIDIITYNLKKMKLKRNRDMIKYWLRREGLSKLNLVNHSRDYYLYDMDKKLSSILRK